MDSNRGMADGIVASLPEKKKRGRNQMFENDSLPKRSERIKNVAYKPNQYPGTGQKVRKSVRKKRNTQSLYVTKTDLEKQLREFRKTIDKRFQSIEVVLKDIQKVLNVKKREEKKT